MDPPLNRAAADAGGGGGGGDDVTRHGGTPRLDAHSR